MNDLETKYGKDVIDLVNKIHLFLEKNLKNRSFDGVYPESVSFSMTPINDIGVFMIKFPNVPNVAIAGIDMNSGDYITSSTNIGKYALSIYEIKDFNVQRLISRAEEEWSFEADTSIQV
jgi:hypothetical protein